MKDGEIRNLTRKDAGPHLRNGVLSAPDTTASFTSRTARKAAFIKYSSAPRNALIVATL